MFTAAKLVGALLFAVLAWFISEQIKDLLPGEGVQATLLSPLNAMIGAAMGWRIMGKHAGEGFTPAVGFGLTSVFATFFWCLLLWSAYEMIRRAVRGRYDGPVEALERMGDLMLEYAILIVTPTVVGGAVIGSLICGLVVEFVSRRWS